MKVCERGVGFFARVLELKKACKKNKQIFASSPQELENRSQREDDLE